ncbi:hypothetical protein EMCRGX_G028524 [Ephydatia muelleri]
MEWHVQVDGKQLNSSVPTLREIVTRSSLSTKNRKIMNASGTECVAYLDSLHSTIRHAECETISTRRGWSSLLQQV